MGDGGKLAHDLPGRTSDGGMVSVDDGPDRLAEVPQEMPPIGYLDRSGCTLTDTIGIGAGTVSGDKSAYQA